jgi:hypothetical protein
MTLASPDPAEAVRLLAADLHAPQATGRSFRRPEVVEAAATEVVNAIREAAPDVILTWDALDDAVLAHVVARQLAIQTVLVHEPQEGIVELFPTLAPGSRVVLLAASFDRTNTIRSAASLVGHRGGLLVAIVSLGPASIADEEVPAGTPYIVLAG